MKDVVSSQIIQFDKKKKIWVPQPTRFWILDKHLHKKISKLEEKGLIKKFEEDVSKDEKLFMFFVKLHEKEIEIRKRILEERFKHLSKTKAFKVLLDKNIGIGGIRDFRDKPFKVKCLHLWTAYHLGDKQFKNPIGEEVLKNI